MFDLKRLSPIQSAKFGVVVTILVFTSACAHKILVRPANNDSGVEEVQQTPEPEVPAQVSSLTQQEPAKPFVAKKKAHKGKKIAKHKHKSKKSSAYIARHKKHKSKQIVTVAKVQDIAPPAPPAAAAPAPEIAMPTAPAPLASAAVQTGLDEDGPNYGAFLLYGLGAISILALIWIAPRARRTKGPKRKLVYNG